MIIFEVVKLEGWEIAHSMAFFISFLMISIKNIDNIHIRVSHQKIDPQKKSILKNYSAKKKNRSLLHQAKGRYGHNCTPTPQNNSHEKYDNTDVDINVHQSAVTFSNIRIYHQSLA